MIVLFFLALAFGAPLAQYTFLEGTPYNYQVGDLFIQVVASDGYYILYRNLSLYQKYDAPTTILGKGIIERNRIIAPAGNKLVFFVLQGQQYKSYVKDSPVWVNELFYWNGRYYGIGENNKEVILYEFDRNFTEVWNKTSIKLSKGGSYEYEFMPWGIFFYLYDNRGNLIEITQPGYYKLWVIPTGPITYNDTHFFVPWYNHIYIYTKDNALVEDLWFPSTVYGATFVNNTLYVHTYNATYWGNSSKEIEHPFWLDAQQVEKDMWIVEGVNFSYLYKEFPRAKYEFKGGDITYYKPLNIFYVLQNNTLSAYRAAGCFFNKRIYLAYCKPINITGQYFLIKPIVMLENNTLSGDLREGIEISPQELSGKYILKCVVENRISDKAEITRTAVGPLDYLNVTVSALEVKEGTPINISIRDMEGNPTTASIYLNGELFKQGSEVLLELEKGIYHINITKECHVPV
ncbi:MAG: hypothetical protein GXN92_01155, partial [Candidatus Micrarchaeota archaeon]|nr:hypothetical protein [Candidatus Micrarchaeota archaeon]